MSWTVYATCGLCSARTPSETSEDHDAASAATDAHAKRLGFVKLTDVKIPDGRRRFETCVCAACAADIVTAVAAAKEPT